MARKLLSPDAARDWLRRRYASQHRAWLGGGGSWPLSVSLGLPTERKAGDPVLVRQWRDSWARWSGAGQVQWQERQWPRLGTQHLPARLLFASPLEVALALGDGARFERAAARHARLLEAWSQLQRSPRVSRHFDALADFPDEDFERLFALLVWLEQHPASGLYVRQLPVAGMDTKWCDARRIAIVSDLLLARCGLDDPLDFHTLSGLRPLPPRLRFRVLCPRLRRALGGLGDVEVPIEEAASLELAPECILIVENLQTGVALPDLCGCVAFMKLGNGVSVLSRLPWARGVRALYWGDIDTHGFAILSHARAALPGVTSIAMDEVTLLENRDLWTREATLYPGASVPLLTDAERLLFDHLRAGTWGHGVRLEQERIPWARAVAAVKGAIER